MVYELPRATVINDFDWYCPECRLITESEYPNVATKRCNHCDKIMQRKQTIETLKAEGDQENDGDSSSDMSALDW